MNMDFESANRARDRRLRRKMLTLLKLALSAPSGEMRGRGIVDVINSDAEAFEDDNHALGLLREMVGKGYFTERDTRTHKHQRFGLDWLTYRITEKGIALWNESAPVDADVEDDRME